ncbi:LysR substrate-binding domain-containing protein [Cellulomonas sp. S1-8]|uniref:LysR substrate-binding domain-containing protein n=1 Tax=Cellulomonas sp. S1-8 TaxID=2904790 RepID=UPI0022430178|nr:LysR substrate-binding domain-containing protein [Cellulomonas sp. S1-8]UZN03929.1 LysR substrate-binding domain-containing protein [Cellulomonas sp. S1-8]
MRLLLVPGTSPDRWARVWRERLPDEPLDVVHGTPADAAAAVLRGDVDAAVLRLPPAGGGAPPSGLPTTTPTTATGWAVVALWTEQSVVVAPQDHVLTVVEEVAVADLAGETVLVPGDDVLGWLPPDVDVVDVPDVPTAADLVVAGQGVLLVPHALARLHDRPGTAVRTVPDAPGSPVVLVWLADREHPHAQELVGIVRGRTVASSRGRGADGRGDEPTTPPRAPRTPRPAQGRTPGRTTGRPPGRTQPRRGR